MAFFCFSWWEALGWWGAVEISDPSAGRPCFPGILSTPKVDGVHRTLLLNSPVSQVYYLVNRAQLRYQILQLDAPVSQVYYLHPRLMECPWSSNYTPLSLRYTTYILGWWGDVEISYNITKRPLLHQGVQGVSKSFITYNTILFYDFI